MRLSTILFGNQRIIPYRYRGKFRKVKKPTIIDLLRIRHDFEREEQNMLILRHPYLTVEQSCGHMKELRKPFNPVLLGKALANEKFTRTVTIMDRLGHMGVKEEWD